MKPSAFRSISIAAFFVFVTVLFVRFVYQSNKTNTSLKEQKARNDIIRQQQQDKSNQINASPDEKFMSFFPHGDFATQHEAVRNAFRIALDLNRTLILPQLRLGKNKDWAPFPVLQNHYESQDKETLKSICQQKKSSDWRTDYQPCQDSNDWIEVPWSTFFDLDLVRDQHNVRVHERKVGHGWGMDDPTTFHLGLSRDDVIVVDPTSFPSNGSDWEMIEQLQQQQQKSNNKAGFKDRFFSTQDGLSQEERDSMTLRLPLKNMVNTTQLLQMDQKYIQFGSLVYGLRFLTSGSKQLVALQKAMRKDVFVVPNQFQPVTQVAKAITKTLGGVEVYSAIHMTMDALARIELENQKMLKKENAEIQGKRFVDTTKVAHADGTPYSVQELLDQLSPKIQTELMSALVRELKGDMPINQAISASLPLEDSSLRDLLSSPSSLEISRRSLLTACIDYRKTEDKTFPIYYLSNDVYDDIIAHRELFGPMIDAFPCTFTKNDIYEWGVVNSNWAKNIYFLTDQDVDYEKLLSPVVEMLVARDGYSFFEVPVTKLTRLLSWH